MLDDDFKKSATEKVTKMSANEYKEAFKNIGSKPQTNDEWRRTCSAEEFSEWLNGLIDYCFGIGHICTSDMKKYDKVTDDPEKWLKETHIKE